MKTLTIINEVNNKFYSSLNEKEFTKLITTIESRAEHFFMFGEEYSKRTKDYIDELYLSIEPYLSDKIKEQPMQVKELIKNYNSIINTLSLRREVEVQQSVEIDTPEDINLDDDGAVQTYLSQNEIYYSWDDDTDGERESDITYDINKSFSMKVPTIDYYGFRFFDTPSDTTPLQARG